MVIVQISGNQSIALVTNLEWMAFAIAYSLHIYERLRSKCTRTAL